MIILNVSAAYTPCHHCNEPLIVINGRYQAAYWTVEARLGTGTAGQWGSGGYEGVWVTPHKEGCPNA